MKSNKKITAVFAGTILLVVLGVTVSLWTFRQIEEASAVRTHTKAVLDGAGDLLTELIDAETGMRGYLLSGDEAFLEPYSKVVGSIRSDLEKLRQLTLDKAAHNHLDALVPLVDAKLAHMAQAIELRRKNNVAAAVAMVRGGQGKRLMDEVRAEMKVFRQLEEELLAQREAEFGASIRDLFGLIIVTILFALLFAAAFALLLYRESKQRIKNLVHLETQGLLDTQEATNNQLQQTNNILQVNEEKLAVTLNSIGDAVMSTDAEARVSLMNPLAEQLTGWTRAEAIGRPVEEIFNIINQETRQPSAVPVMETLEHGTIQGLANHTILIARDGSECAIADSCAPIRDRDGQIVGAVLVFRDVTEEYAVQQALRDSSAQIKTILNTVVDGIITLHASGGIVETVNPAAERMFGYSAAELIGNNFSMLIPELDRDQRNGSLEYYSASDEARAAGLGREVVGWRKDGSMFPMEITVSEMWLGGQRYFTGILRDIAARKQAEEALLKAGALQSAIFNSANFSSIATDAKGVIQIFNVGAERMLGYAAADVMNKITPADISDPQEVIARAKALSTELGTPITPGFDALVFKASRGIEDIYELTYIRKDGSRFPAVVSVTALRDDLGGIIGYLLIGTDNTARKQIEAERQRLLEIQEETHNKLLQTNVTLQVSEEKLSVTLNSIGDGVITADAQGRVALLNPLAEQLTGWMQAEAVGRPVEDIFHIINKETRLPSIIPVMATLAKGTIQGLANHTVLIAADGSECDIADSCAPIRDRDGHVIGAVLVFRDVTGEYAVQKALSDQQFYTRSLIESNIDALMTTDPSGIITDVNQQMVELTGCTRDELIGSPFKDYFTDPERAEAGIKRVLSEKKVTDYELTASHKKDGETVVSYNAATFYDRDGKLQGVFAAARDVTERKRIDQVLQEKNVELEDARFVAEKANLAKSIFLSRMSHELRTPLNAILGFAQLLEGGTPPPTSAQVVRLNQITKAGWYLLELINEILDLALIESGRLSFSREPVSLIEVMHECRAMIGPQSQAHGIQVDFLPFDSSWYANADRTRIKQIILNLLTNAIKYNCANGTVEVSCTLSTPERIRISIKDTGAGLPPEKLLQLFQPFNRLGQEAGAEEGTGIGLVVAKQLVELMGGAIGVQSTVGLGSEFWIELIRTAAPKIIFEKTKTLGQLVPQVEGNNKENPASRILLYVEDNPANLMLVEQIMADQPGVRMLSARDGNIGIALARTYLPDVILMDINLPGISGIEAMNILRKDPATKHIPIIALSANAMIRDIEKGLEAGFFRYLTKPIKVYELMAALDEALDLSSKESVKAHEIGKIR